MKKFEDEKDGRVVRRYCDKAMARRKYMPCDKQCKRCHACIEVLESGARRHFSGRK